MTKTMPISLPPTTFVILSEAKDPRILHSLAATNEPSNTDGAR
jgi:hypothetical protein